MHRSVFCYIKFNEIQSGCLDVQQGDTSVNFKV